MTRTRRNTTALLVMIFATAVIALRASAVEAPGATGTQAEIQIGVCAPAAQIVQALDLHPRGTPIEVWQFDDAALILFGRGLRLRLRMAADGRSEFTLKVADQDCARVDPKLIPPGEGKCEYDVYGTSTASAVSLTRSFDPKSTDDLLAGRIAPAQALSVSQITYPREMVGEMCIASRRSRVVIASRSGRSCQCGGDRVWSEGDLRSGRREYLAVFAWERMTIRPRGSDLKLLPSTN